jgi:YNFM family putative membrane transporter
MTQLPEQKINKIPKGTLLLIIFSAIAAYSLKHGPQPLIPLITQDFALSPAQGSLVVAAEMAGMSTMLLLNIVLADFLNRKWVTGISLCVAALIAGVISLTPLFSVIVALRFVQGMLLGTFPALMVAYINEEFVPQRVGTLIGIYLGSTAAGGLLGRMSTTLISNFYSWRQDFLILAVWTLVIGILYCCFLPTSKHTIAEPRLGSVKNTIFPLFTSKPLLLLCLLGFIFMGTFAAIYTYITFTLLAEPYNLSKTTLASIFLMQLCGSFSSAISGRYVDKLGNNKVMFISILVLIGGAVITLFPPLASKFIGLGVFIAGMFGAHVSATSWIGRIPGISKAPATSLYMLFYYIGGSLLSILGGILYKDFGWSGVITMICICGFIGLVALKFLIKISPAGPIVVK